MSNIELKNKIKNFVDFWTDKGYEKGQSQTFWLQLLSQVYGIEKPEEYIEFEDQVHIDKTTGFIDAYIPKTRVLIEQKSIDKDLRKGIRQSDGSMLNPFQQAKKYIAELPVSMHPKWVITCNFKSFLIYNMENPNGEPEELFLKDLEKEYYRLQFMVDATNTNLKKEMEISIQAGELVGKIYDEILPLYKDAENKETLKSLNMLCVRLVFCLYAEDAGLFGKHQMFHDYLSHFEVRDLRRALIDLFKVLDQKADERDPYLNEDLAQFPYVNGGLFADENIEIPNLNEKVRELLLTKASEDFDWSDISPTIFGAVFESTLNPETRRSGGMHYTSIENIHKVIDPLFLNDLEEELNEILSLKVLKIRKLKIIEFQEKISKLKFLDPACGSGNFLTETYLSLRRLENKAIESYQDGQIGFADENLTPIKVSIGQFYGIEINDYAVTVAKTALWIAESQMMHETEKILHMNLDFLPLKSYTNIIEGNALKDVDWNDVIDKTQVNYIMGNPPFIGGMYMSAKQKSEIREIFKDLKGAGELDYVCAWYKKSAEFIENTNIRVTFVSTNSICQGEQVITFWKYMIEKYSIHIDYAYTTFVWDSESNGQAKVHCVIVSFSNGFNSNEKRLYEDKNKFKLCKNISPYLTDTPNFFVESRSTPLCDVPAMKFGSMPRDGGGFVLTPEDRTWFEKNEPISKKWIRPYIGAAEFLNNKERYCFWLVDAEPNEINKCHRLKERIQNIKKFREESKAAGTRKFAATPTLFCQIAQPNVDYIMVPKTSSGKRKYLPIGFQNKDTIASDLVFLIPNAGMYEFGVLMSNVHNAWMRTVAGRLKSDYRYSKDIVYNNFPWPNPTQEQKEKIKQTANLILEVRKRHKESTLSDLYNDDIMPSDLRMAHILNNKAVMEAYGFPVRNTFTESMCVAELMKMYQEMMNK